MEELSSMGSRPKETTRWAQCGDGCFPDKSHRYASSFTGTAMYVVVMLFMLMDGEIVEAFPIRNLLSNKDSDSNAVLRALALWFFTWKTGVKLSQAFAVRSFST